MMLIYIGILLASLSAFKICGEYISYMTRRLSECESFLLFTEHMQIEVGCFLKAPRELIRDFNSDALAKTGFLQSLEEGEELYTAYMRCEGKLSLGENEKKILSELFSSLGKGYLDDSMKMIDAAKKALSASYERLRVDCPKQKKLAASLSACAVLGFIILVI